MEDNFKILSLYGLECIVDLVGADKLKSILEAKSTRDIDIKYGFIENRILNKIQKFFKKDSVSYISGRRSSFFEELILINGPIRIMQDFLNCFTIQHVLLDYKYALFIYTKLKEYTENTYLETEPYNSLREKIIQSRKGLRNGNTELERIYSDKAFIEYDNERKDNFIRDLKEIGLTLEDAKKYVINPYWAEYHDLIRLISECFMNQFRRKKEFSNELNEIFANFLQNSEKIFYSYWLETYDVLGSVHHLFYYSESHFYKLMVDFFNKQGDEKMLELVREKAKILGLKIN